MAKPIELWFLFAFVLEKTTNFLFFRFSFWLERTVVGSLALVLVSYPLVCLLLPFKGEGERGPLQTNGIRPASRKI